VVVVCLAAHLEPEHQDKALLEVLAAVHPLGQAVVVALVLLVLPEVQLQSPCRVAARVAQGLQAASVVHL
jgi:hypothetical protein